jgi:hypothetical protein
MAQINNDPNCLNEYLERWNNIEMISMNFELTSMFLWASLRKKLDGIAFFDWGWGCIIRMGIYFNNSFNK